MVEDSAPSRWRPGEAFVAERQTRVVLIGRELLTAGGRRMCTVLERAIVPDEVGAYLRRYRSPRHCPPPWGDYRPRGTG